MKYTKCHEVIAGKDRRRPRQHTQQPLGGLETTPRIKSRLLNKLRSKGQACFAHGLFETIQALDRVGKRGRSRDDGQVAVSRFDQMLCSMVGAHFIGHYNSITGPTLRAAIQANDGRTSRSARKKFRIEVTPRSWNDQQARGAERSKFCEIGSFLSGIVI